MLAMQTRRLVSCGQIGADIMQVTASDGTVWLHRIERDEVGRPAPEQINAWLNLIWAPGSGLNKTLSACIGSTVSHRSTD